MIFALHIFWNIVATEFDIQGLELDWACVVWDADFRLLNQKLELLQV